MSSENRANRGEINRLTKAIDAEGQTINAIFQRMGQTYFAAHQNDPEEAQVSNVLAVQEAMKRAKLYKDQINALRGITVCPGCRAEVSVNAAFCSCCGTRLPRQAPAPVQVSGLRVCPSCGTTAAPGNRFCNRCGTRLPEAAPQPAQSPAEQAPIPRGNPAVASNPSSVRAEMPVEVPRQAPARVESPARIPPLVQTQRPEPQAPVGSPVPPVQPPAASAEPLPAPEPEQPELTPVAAETETPPEATVPARKICPRCGTELDPDYRFCLECGAPV